MKSRIQDRPAALMKDEAGGRKCRPVGNKKPALEAPVFIHSRAAGALSVRLHRENLTAPVHAGLQVDMVRAAKLAGILVLDVGRGLKGVGGATHAAPRGRRFSFRNGHFRLQSKAERPLETGKRSNFNLDKVAPHTSYLSKYPALKRLIYGFRQDP
jgi:hypothetical protein